MPDKYEINKWLMVIVFSIIYILACGIAVALQIYSGQSFPGNTFEFALHSVVVGWGTSHFIRLIRTKSKPIKWRTTIKVMFIICLLLFTTTIMTDVPAGHAVINKDLNTITFRNTSEKTTTVTINAFSQAISEKPMPADTVLTPY